MRRASATAGMKLSMLVPGLLGSAAPKSFASTIGSRRRRLPVIVRSFARTIGHHSLAAGTNISATEARGRCDHPRAFVSSSLGGIATAGTNGRPATIASSDLSRCGDVSSPNFSTRTSVQGDEKLGTNIGSSPSSSRNPSSTIVSFPRLEPRNITRELEQESGPGSNGDTLVALSPGEVDGAPGAHRSGDQIGVEKVSHVLAYHAQIRVGSIVLHFRAKGLRPGAFVFLATQGVDPATSRQATGSTGRGTLGREESLLRVGDMDEAKGSILLSTADTFAGDECDAASGGQGDFECEDASGDGCESLTSAADGNVGGNGRAAGVTSGRGRSECWLTNENLPLRRALPLGWMGAGGSMTMSEGAIKLPSKQVVASGKEVTEEALSATASGGDGDNKGDSIGYEQALGSNPLPQSTPMITLWLTPSGRAPLPSICCGVCGSSWEQDTLGKGFRVYHLAVANNTLLWYVRRRFSEFLALHAALVKEGKEADRGSQGIIPADRLPRPPTRTFGLFKLFPGRMERFRREQLDSFMQELLAVPEATTSRLLLAFLGLITSSRHDLMSLADDSPPATARVPMVRPDHPIPCPLRSTENASSKDDDTRSVQCSSDKQLLPIISPSGETARNQGGASQLRLNLTSVEVGDEVTSHRPPIMRISTKAQGGVSSGGEAVSLPPLSPEDSRRDAGGEGVSESGDIVIVGADGERKVERVSNLEDAARGGDVFLFRCRGILNQLQRWVSRSEWDHVGVAVCRGHLEPLELLESVQGGVRLYPLVERVRAYQEEGLATRVAFRKLECPRPLEARARLAEFARRAEGKAYGFIVPFHPPAAPPPRRTPAWYPERPAPPGPSTPMLRRSSFSGGSWDATESRNPPAWLPRRSYSVGVDRFDGNKARWKTNSGDEASSSSSTYLCSQLVGDALEYMGMLREGGPGDMRWLWVFPGAFGRGGLVERGLAPGVSLGEEILVDGHEPEVVGAVLYEDFRL